MMVAAGQTHPDTFNYLRRVDNGEGAVRTPVQLAIDTFVKFCYRRNLRSNNGTTHAISMCYIPCTTELVAGTYEKLWFRNGDNSAVVVAGAPSYSEIGGMSVNGNTTFLDSGIPANALNINNFSLLIHNLTHTGNRDYFGVSDGTNRLLIHPRWIDDNNLYFDVINSSAGRASIANVTNSLGLIIGTKSNATQTVYQRGTNIRQITTAPTTGTLPTGTIDCMFANAGDITTARSIGGFGTVQASISAGIVSPFTTTWNAIQTALGR